MRIQLLVPVIGVLLAGVFVGGVSYFAPPQGLQKTGVPNYLAQAGLAPVGPASSVAPQSIGSVGSDFSMLLQLASVLLASLLVAAIVSVTSRRRKKTENLGANGTTPAE